MKPHVEAPTLPRAVGEDRESKPEQLLTIIASLGAITCAILPQVAHEVGDSGESSPSFSLAFTWLRTRPRAGPEYTSPSNERLMRLAISASCDDGGYKKETRL